MPTQHIKQQPRDCLVGYDRAFVNSRPMSGHQGNMNMLKGREGAAYQSLASL